MSDYTTLRSRSMIFAIIDMNTAQKYLNGMERNQWGLKRARNEEAAPTIGPGRMARLSLPVKI